MPFPLIPLMIGASGLLTYFGQRQSQKKANEANIQLAREARDYDSQMWNKSNLYNSPVQQMQRLTDAGLNKNLIYGTGNVAGLSSSTPPKSPVANVNPLPFPKIDALQTLSAYSNIEQTKASTDLIRKNIEVQEQKRINDSMRPYLLELEGNKKYLDYTQAKKLAQTQISVAENNMIKGALQNKLLSQELNVKNPLLYKNLEATTGLNLTETELKKLELEMQQGLKPYNMTTSDPTWLRMLMNFRKNYKEGKNFFGEQ